MERFFAGAGGVINSRMARKALPRVRTRARMRVWRNLQCERGAVFVNAAQAVDMSGKNGLNYDEACQSKPYTRT
jgi:hypothetical protein